MPEAENDVREIRTYIAQTNPQVAAKWVRGCRRLIASLGTLPERYEVIPEASEILPAFRHLIYGSHRIIYYVGDDEVAVLHVIRAARKLRRVWFETAPEPE